MEFFLISLLNGVSYGLLLFMLSSGLTLIFSMMGVLNFAHASFYMVGAYFAYSIGLKIGLLAGAGPRAGAGRACSARWSSATACARCTATATSPELLFTFGLAYLIEEAVQGGLGPAPRSPTACRQILDGPLFTLYSTSFPKLRGFMMLVAVVMLLVGLPAAHAHAHRPGDPGRAHAIRRRWRRSATTCRACSCWSSAAAARWRAWPA